MKPEDIEQRFTEFETKLSEKDKVIEDLKNQINILRDEYDNHSHLITDGTRRISRNIAVPPGSSISLGVGQLGSINQGIKGDASELIQTAITAGADDSEGWGNTSINAQFNILHFPNGNNSFITASRNPFYNTAGSANISTTSGTSTVTVNGFNFPTNSLAGCTIDIYDTNQAYIETRIIASNTSTVITISGTWGASTTGVAVIKRLMFMGSAEAIWQRAYVQEGTAGGVRFGMGVTAGPLNQNGLLYMDGTGDLYWRNKSGTSTKLN